MSTDSLVTLMERFVSGQDRSLAIAGEIEVGLEQVFADEEPFADLALALASYRPGGGEYLYDEQRIARLMMHVIAEIAARRTAAR